MKWCTQGKYSGETIHTDRILKWNNTFLENTQMKGSTERIYSGEAIHT